jgi:acyl-CoA synthetase (AMP-forming)/AMP-acid ligase II
VLQSHPDVLEAAVVGWPDNDKLIKPKAFVVLKSPETAGDALARTLLYHCRQNSPSTNTRAGSNSAASCRKPRPAKSNASSCGPRLTGSDGPVALTLPGATRLVE